jgi:hypothetical protein
MTRTARTLIAAFGAVVVLGLGGCGKTDDGAQVASANGGSAAAATAQAEDQPAVDEDERRQQFTQCMRDNGVDLSDPAPGGGGEFRVEGAGPDKEKMQAALEACRKFMPDGGERAAPSPEDLEKLREMAQCMREHGVDMPDPDPNGGGIVISKDAQGEPEIDEERLNQAFEACRHLGPKIDGDGGPKVNTETGPQIGAEK